MENLRELRLKTNCNSCIHKCCSQPYDWVYLTASEMLCIKAASGLKEEAFVMKRKNTNTDHVFNTLSMPCRFLDSATGQCTIYDSRPLVCRLFPFYPEPLTGHATLLPVQCGVNLEFLAFDSDEGWRLADFEENVRQWLADLWKEAMLKT
jgi:Fe-S-cluster containining protein